MYLEKKLSGSVYPNNSPWRLPYNKPTYKLFTNTLNSFLPHHRKKDFRHYFARTINEHPPKRFTAKSGLKV